MPEKCCGTCKHYDPQYQINPALPIGEGETAGECFLIPYKRKAVGCKYFCEHWEARDE